MTIGDNLRRIRKTRGLTLQDVSAVTDIQVSELSRIEANAKTNIQLKTLAKILYAIGGTMKIQLAGCECCKKYSNCLIENGRTLEYGCTRFERKC